MLVPQNISPDDCVYYNTAFVLKVLLQQGEMPLAELFCEVRSGHRMTFEMFLHCLDWLFLIHAIKHTDETIILCS